MNKEDITESKITWWTEKGLAMCNKPGHDWD